jgi:hypothetical protein
MRGIQNLGNTCHFSSAIQCLLAVPLPTSYDGECGFTRLWVDFARRHRDGGDALDPEPLFREFQKHFPRINEFEENDLQETVLLVVDILEKQFPVMREMFYGTKIQETVYPGGTNVHEDAFSALILPMEVGGDMGAMMEKSCAWSVLGDFTDTDGKIHNVATTRTMIKKFPEVAMFTFDRKGVVVARPGLTTDQGAYQLVAAGAHVGTQGGGHYVSLVRDGERWHLCDDERVAQVTFESRFEYSLLVYLKV